MPLRWTVTEKWKDKWFRQLKPRFKLLWLYLLDNCNVAGLIEYDPDLWRKETGGKISNEEFLEIFSEKTIFVPKTEYVWIPKFIEIQQGCKIEELNPANNAHKGIFKSIEKYNLLSIKPGANEGLPSPTSKGNGKSNGKGKGKEKEEKKTFGEFKNVFLTEDERVKLNEKLGSEYRAIKAIEILSAYKKSKNRHYDSDYATFHTWVISELEKRENKGNNIKPDPPMQRKPSRCTCGKETNGTILCEECTEKRRQEDEKMFADSEKRRKEIEDLQNKTPKEVREIIKQDLKIMEET